MTWIVAEAEEVMRSQHIYCAYAVALEAIESTELLDG